MCRIARHGTAEILAQQWNAVNADFASLTPLLDFLGGTLSLPKRGRMSIVGNKIGRRTRLFLLMAAKPNRGTAMCWAVAQRPHLDMEKHTQGGDAANRVVAEQFGCFGYGLVKHPRTMK